ncbi:uroporphyrinogen-III C-methyltransferase [Alkaliphilus hydrothermalis]|uniref:uroporphyrinogen-III C-methyltransferase n=1 Tax=Alkaliphilus hydrothermalis TaxID=1482730 RepID=A0ABS2NPH4_9FIRM|nr:uroporphyrinogen-III C-methyltransferase [Alkaliphilus hydrothermalis]MBM7614717.1 uroporphyrinogen III methyltransferase/synthase [Alkaliphilus hydrothermalis]
MKKPYVYLVGAGPGDEGLITVKGLECLKKADVILYDRLANPSLLRYRKEGAVCIDVGKSPHRHKYTQDEINSLLIQKAKEGNVVTRLKGGDPYVFGRGGEEGYTLHQEGIPFEVVPGITSAIGAANYGGIPVTHRNISTSFHVITGHEDPTKEKTTVNYKALAQLEGTLIFLMGVGNLQKITGELMKYGKSKDTPVALVHRGTTGRQRTVTGTLENIVEVVERNQVTFPSIIIVGEVVNLRNQLNWFENLPLQGKKILVTRSRQQASELSNKLKALGGEIIEFPTIEIKPCENLQEIDAKIKEIPKSQYTIFTSVNGVNSFFKRLKEMKLDIRAIGDSKMVAIGTATAEALEDKGLVVEIVPEVFTAEGILERLQGVIQKGDRISIPRAEIARRNLVTGLLEMGAIVDEIPIYQTVIPTHRREELLEILEEGIDVITFTSSSTANNLMEILGEENKGLLENSKIAVIGPITGNTVRELGLTIDFQGKEYTIEGLINGILEGYNGNE